MASLERDTVIWIIIAMISGFYIGLHSASFIFKRNTSHQQTCTPESEVKTLAQTIPDYASTCNDLSRLEFPARPLHVILIATGSVASVKVPFMVTELLKVIPSIPVVNTTLIACSTVPEHPRPSHRFSIQPALL